MSRTVLVTGSRDYADAIQVAVTLDCLHRENPITKLVHGAAKGADSLADAWAKRHGVESVPVVAEWKKFGPRAGPIRNQRMLDEYRIDLVVCFPGQRGTRDMVTRALDDGVPVVDHFLYPIRSPNDVWQFNVVGQDRKGNPVMAVEPPNAL